MSTNPQAPQAPRSGAAAEGQSGPAYDPKAPPTPAGSEGRQSPGPAPSECEAKLWGLLDDIDTLSDAMKPEKTAYYMAVQKLAAQRFKVLTSDGYNLYRATPSQEEGPAGVDLADLLDEAARNLSKDIPCNPDGSCIRCRTFRAAARLRAQAPASSPRDLEALAKAKGYRDIAEDLLRKAIGIANEPSPKWYKDSDAKISAIKGLADVWDQEAKRLRARLAAHPPKGETPSEAETIRELREDLAIREDALVAALAARNAIEKAAREAAAKLVSSIYFADSSDYKTDMWQALAFLSPEAAELLEHDERAAYEKFGGASLSSLPQEGASDDPGCPHGFMDRMRCRKCTDEYLPQEGGKAVDWQTVAEELLGILATITVLDDADEMKVNASAGIDYCKKNAGLKSVHVTLDKSFLTEGAQEGAAGEGGAA